MTRPSFLPRAVKLAAAEVQRERNGSMASDSEAPVSGKTYQHESNFTQFNLNRKMFKKSIYHSFVRISVPVCSQSNSSFCLFHTAEFVNIFFEKLYGDLSSRQNFTGDVSDYIRSWVAASQWTVAPVSVNNLLSLKGKQTVLPERCGAGSRQDGKKVIGHLF